MAHREEYRLVFAADCLADDHPEFGVAIDRAMEALGLEAPHLGSVATKKLTGTSLPLCNGSRSSGVSRLPG